MPAVGCGMKVSDVRKDVALSSSISLDRRSSAIRDTQASELQAGRASTRGCLEQSTHSDRVLHS